MNALVIARFTIQEAISRRLVLAGLLISLGYVALFALGFHLLYDKAFERVEGAQARLTLGVAIASLVVLGLYVVNYLANFLALFLPVGAISGEIDSGTLHAVLARPIRRTEFVLGRWLAYALMMSVYVSGMTGLVLLVARWVADYEVPDALGAILLMCLGAILLLTLSLLGSTLLSTLANGVTVFTLLGLAWLAGMIEAAGRLLGNTTLLDLGTAVSLLVPSDALWRGASFFLQSPSLRAATSVGGAIPFFSNVPVAGPLVVWALGYVVVVLAGAAYAFGRRDL